MCVCMSSARCCVYRIALVERCMPRERENERDRDANLERASRAVSVR